MPILNDYYCENCENVFESFDGKCKKCSAKGLQQMSAPKIINGGEYFSGNSITGIKPVNRSKRFSK